MAGGFAYASLSAPAGMSNKLKDAFAAQSVKESDLLYMSFPLCHEGTNLNGDEFLASEMQIGHKSIIGQQVDKDHLQDIDSIIGRHYDAQYEILNGAGLIMTQAYIYAALYPDIVVKILDGAINAMSMEVHFEWAEKSFAKRTLHELNFKGSGMVRTPADPKALLTVNEKRMATKASLNAEESYRRRQLMIAVAAVLAQEAS